MELQIYLPQYFTKLKHAILKKLLDIGDTQECLRGSKYLIKVFSRLPFGHIKQFKTTIHEAITSNNQPQCKEKVTPEAIDQRTQ